jgi:hypothetical protein
MAVGIVQDFPKAQSDALELYDKVNAEVTGNAPPKGLLFHWVARRGDGLRIVDVWESQAAFDEFAKTRLVPASMKHNLPQPHIETFEVHNIIKA